MIDIPDGMVVVVGLGRSGASAADLLLRAGRRVVVTEAEEDPSRGPGPPLSGSDPLRDRAARLVAAGAEVRFGVRSAADLPPMEGVGLVVTSPGVGRSCPVSAEAAARGVPVMGEFELGMRTRRAPAVVVTGSNGKTTTATLVHALLSASGVPAVLCGNVGTPVTEGLDPAGEPGLVVVAEASSYQLESCARLAPRAAVFLNLADNHLERHGSPEAYRAAKLKIFEGQSGSDVAVVNRDDPAVWSAVPGLAARVVPFGRALGDEEEGVRIEPRTGSLTVRRGSRVGRYGEGDLRLPGVHNLYNAAAAIAVVEWLRDDLAAAVEGPPRDALRRDVTDRVDASVRAALASFLPLRHRLEPVGTAGGVTWINDSKSTTPASTAAALDWALGAYPGAVVRLLAGGKLKQGSWEPVRERLAAAGDRVPKVYGFGDGAGRVAREAAGAADVSVHPTLAGALAAARAEARRGDVVLVSPGGASFDEFSDFERRGDAVRDAVAGFEAEGETARGRPRGRVT